MADPGQDAAAPEEAPLPEGMQVERALLDDGRSLLLFTWDEPA